MQSIRQILANIKDFSNFQYSSLLFIIMTIIFGSSMLVLPVQAVFLVIIAIAGMLFFIKYPQFCFYLIIFTLPFADTYWYFFGSPAGIAMHDILIMVCIIAVSINIIMKDERVDFSTPLDKWFFVLIPLYIFAGLNSTNFNKGILVSAKFIEAVIAYYLTVYFIRTRKISISNIFTALLFTALFQSLLGILQSLTGKFGIVYTSDRGYLGYFGIGSSQVFQAAGTFGHFATLGHYLLTVLLLYIPVYYFISRKEYYHKIIIAIMFMALIMTYSRGAFSAFVFSFVYFLYFAIKEKKRFFLALAIIAMIFMPVSYYLSHTSYVFTLRPRNEIWEIHWAYITNNLDKIWMGNGLNSVADTIWQYMPQDQLPTDYTSWTAHNLYLWYLEEMGIIGLIIYFSFLVFIFLQTLKNVLGKTPKLLKVLSLSLNIALFGIFYGGINDHV